MLFGVRKIDPLIKAPTPCYLCWYCGKQLPSIFTSVDKNGERLRVHIECCGPAAQTVALIQLSALSALRFAA